APQHAHKDGGPSAGSCEGSCEQACGRRGRYERGEFPRGANHFFAQWNRAGKGKARSRVLTETALN
ncbi:unnamed protein product, partial [Phaeothamnion confervicola]